MAEKGKTVCGPMPRRSARNGEVCCCGQPAVVVVISADLGPVPFCGTASRNHRPSDCPPWCAQDHALPYDRKHMGASHTVSLESHAQQIRVGREWRTWLRPLLVGLTKEPNSKPAYIEVIGVDDQVAGCLTASEAERLAGILRDLAATLRGESHVNAA